MRYVLYALLALSAAAMLKAVELDPPRLSYTVHFSHSYVDGGYVVNPDPIISTTTYVSWYGFYMSHWELWDLSSYQSPERSGKYNNSRQYRIELCNYAAGYTAPLDKFGLPLKWSVQAKYTQYPHRRSYRKMTNGHIRDHHVKGEQLASFFRFNNILPESFKVKFLPTIEIDYQPLSYYWLIKGHSNLYYQYNDRIRIGVNQTLYTKPSRAHYASTKHTGYAITSMTATPYVRYKLSENLSLRVYVGFAAALEQHTRDIWRKNALNNRRNHWCGASITYNF